ncbi:hypothetical protein TWF696_006221 [Orbilia brochopaga]|uniref:Uncharacterized protein n=1 Tax=Orbilia brochopaga TaxID=3140254 RepID=A0AAV9UX01_9PEZI
MSLKRPIPLPQEQQAPVVLPAPADDEIITLPAPKKLRVGLQRAEEDKAEFNPDSVLAGANDLRNRLAAFLPSLKAADEQLERERLAGKIADRRMEISDSDDEDSSSSNDEEDEDEGSGDSDDDGDEEEELPQGGNVAEVLIANLLAAGEENTDPSPKKRKRKPRAPYIEMVGATIPDIPIYTSHRWTPVTI